jgi:hypothetical protein
VTIVSAIPRGSEYKGSDYSLYSDPQLLDTRVGGESYDLIQGLATESDRYTGRRERNAQRSCFRDILSTLEEGRVPDREVRFGVELLPLDSWARLIQYNVFKELLGSGLKTHIQGNDLLRDIFQLGPAPAATVDSKASRLEKVRRQNLQHCDASLPPSLRNTTMRQWQSTEASLEASRETNEQSYSSSCS